MYIYQIKNTITSDFYIGKTKQLLEKRYYQHKYNAFKLNCQSHLYNAMRKYGESNFVITILENVKDNSMLNEREIHFIKLLSPKYNMTKGGDGGNTSNSVNFINSMKKYHNKKHKMEYATYGMLGKKQSEKFYKSIKISNSCPVMCEGVKFNSVGEAQSAYPGISIRKRLNNPKYPQFYRLRPIIKRK